MIDVTTRSNVRSERLFVARVLGASALVVMVIPVDFVRVDQLWRYVTLAGLVIGVVLAVYVIARSDTAVVKPALAFGFAVMAFNQLMNFNPIGFLTLLAPVVIGAALATIVRSALAVVIGLSILLAVAMATEFVLQQHLFGQLFGSENYVAYASDTFRARGLIGQAVPAAMIAVGLGSAGLALTAPLDRNRGAARWTITVSTAVSVLASGTRSAILCAVALALLCGSISLYRNKTRRLSIGREFAWAGPLLLAVGVVATTFWWTVLSNQRVFSFTTLSGSASLDNRNYAALVFDNWEDTCNGACVVFGSGARSLLQALAGGLGFRGFTTVDNLFLSLLWDFGAVMLAGLAVLLVVAVRVLILAPSATNRAGALVVVSILLSGLFYDALYIRPTLLLFGFGIGLLGLRAGSKGGSTDG